MKWVDYFYFAFGALRGFSVRTILMLVAMSFGVAAVIVLTGLGDGARRFIASEFASLGTNLLIVLPGKSETAGVSPGSFVGQTTRDLTIDDALSLTRNSTTDRIAVITVGAASVSRGRLDREVTIVGTSHHFLDIYHWKMAQGRFLPKTDMRTEQSVIVLGATLKEELFKAENPVGEWVRVGDRRFRVIGVIASEGQSFGMDAGDMAIVPVSSAQSLFNQASLFRILIEAKNRDVLELAKKQIINTLKERHQGEEDVTVISQDAVLQTFDNIFKTLTYSVAGIAAVSLIVAGILIMNVMLISVSQRTAEIGLLKALGAKTHEIQNLFLVEAVLLSVLGATIGLIIGDIGCRIIATIYPDFPAGAPMWAIFSAFFVSVVTGLLFGVSPAKRAAKLDAVEALSK